MRAWIVALRQKSVCNLFRNAAIDGGKLTLWVNVAVLGTWSDVGSRPNNDQTDDLDPGKKQND